MAASGAYIVVADGRDGLVRASAADIGVLANSGEVYAESVPSVSGNLLFVADSLANNDGLLEQSLDSLSATPVGLGGGWRNILSHHRRRQRHLPCGGQSESDANVRHACITDVGRSSASWEPGCLGRVSAHTLDSLATEALHGPALVMTYQSPQSPGEARLRIATAVGTSTAVEDHILLSDNDTYDSTNDAATPGSVSLGTAQAEIASHISVQGALAAASTSAGVKYGQVAFVELTGDVIETVDLAARKVTAAFSLNDLAPHPGARPVRLQRLHARRVPAQDQEVSICGMDPSERG